MKENNSDIEIKIWSMVDGEPTALKIKDMIIQINDSKNSDSEGYYLNPIEVANNFIKTFDLSKPIKYINQPSEKDTIYGRNSLLTLYDVLTLYEYFKESEFSAVDINIYFKNKKIKGIGAVTSHTIVKWLEDKNCIQSTGDDNHGNCMYTFTVIKNQNGNSYDKISTFKKNRDTLCESNVSFDSDELRTRRELELQTLRRGK